MIPHPQFSIVESMPTFEFTDASGASWEGLSLVHGGAWDIPSALRQAHQVGVEEAYQKLVTAAQGSKVDALDLVACALESLESDPTFDAGYGSFLNERGEVELDAGVMEGQDLNAGSVAALGAFRHPGRVALAVLRETEHVLLVGQGATAFALKQGFCPVPPRSLVHPREQMAFEKWIAAGKPSAKTFFGDLSKEKEALTASGPEPDKRGTVGVVLALRPRQSQSQSQSQSQNWQLFAGTSTGGTPGKMWGRVGDVPIPGAGFYADNEGACVSATGWGEAFLRTLPCKTVSDLCASGMHPQQACEQVLAHMLRRTGGRGGLIAISKTGDVGAAFTTPDMAVRSPKCAKIQTA